MTQANVFALRNSGLEAFLFAEVGTELNGSGLTVLSGLARLGDDPWAEAARLANAPGDEAAAWLTSRIRMMPLAEDGLMAAAAIAQRLAALLPKPAGSERSEAAHPKQSLKGLSAAMAFCLLYLLFAASISLVAKPGSPAAAPAAPSMMQGQ